MNMLGFVCTTSEGWDPLCQTDQLVFLLLVGAVGGALLVWGALHNRNVHVVVSVLLYGVCCLVGAVASAVAGLALS